MDKLYIVDRFEGDYIILETPDGSMVDVERNKVIGKVKEGDCLVKKKNHYWGIEKKTEKRGREIAEKMKGMWND